MNIKSGEKENQRRLKKETKEKRKMESRGNGKNRRKIGFITLLVVMSLVFFIDSFFINLYGYEIRAKSMGSSGKKQNIEGAFSKTTSLTEDKETGILSYSSPNMAITIEPIEEDNLKMWISTIKIKEASQLNSAFAKDEFNLTNRETTSDMAKRHDAIFAINGAAAGFNEKSFVIRDGINYRATDLDCAPLIIKENGDFEIFNYGEKTGEEILTMGGRHTYDFGPDLIKNGEIVDYGDGWYKEGKDPRTAIGQKGSLEYVVIVADGRSKESEGIAFYDLALEFQERGCEWAYALDGGGSTTLYFNGKVLNRPSQLGIERRVTDILYFK